MTYQDLAYHRLVEPQVPSSSTFSFGVKESQPKEHIGSFSPGNDLRSLGPPVLPETLEWGYVGAMDWIF